MLPWSINLAVRTFIKREDAVRKLAALRVNEPPPQLLAALQSQNPEVRKRAAEAIKGLRERIALSRFRAERRFAKRGQIELFIASTATCPWKADDDRLWVPAFAVGTTAAARAGLKDGRRITGGPIYVQDFPNYRKINPKSFVRTNGVFARDEKATQSITVPSMPLVLSNRNRFKR